MTPSLEALRDYVHFLHEHEGVRQIKLTRTARAGLAKISAARVATQSPADNRRPAGDSAAFVGPDEPALGGRRLPDTEAGRAAVTRELIPFATLPLPVEHLLDIPGSSKAEQLRHLGERASVCSKCPHLAARRHTVVFGIGDPDAKLMFIGEGPGEDEDLKGEPFVGRAGQLLTKMITAMGLTRQQVYIANIVKCRPDMPPGVPGNRKPTKQEMETCVPYLRAQIHVIQPAVMVALGATAVEGLLGPVGTIGSLRGKYLEYRGMPLMPTYHPSYLLRNASNTEKRKVWEDLLKVMERLQMPITDKQHGFFLAK